MAVGSERVKYWGQVPGQLSLRHKMTRGVAGNLSTSSRMQCVGMLGFYMILFVTVISSGLLNSCRNGVCINKSVHFHTLTTKRKNFENVILLSLPWSVMHILRYDIYN